MRIVRDTLRITANHASDLSASLAVLPLGAISDGLGPVFAFGVFPAHLFLTLASYHFVPGVTNAVDQVRVAQPRIAVVWVGTGRLAFTAVGVDAAARHPDPTAIGLTDGGAAIVVVFPAAEVLARISSDGAIGNVAFCVRH